MAQLYIIKIKEIQKIFEISLTRVKEYTKNNRKLEDRLIKDKIIKYNIN